jgi:hypothetical protein
MRIAATQRMTPAMEGLMAEVALVKERGDLQAQKQ